MWWLLWVVICLKSLTFVVSITTYAFAVGSDRCCDLLEKSYLCGINNNKPLCRKTQDAVVICLKSLTFVVSITTRYLAVYRWCCCDLLEKSYLCGINNNELRLRESYDTVVICLKSLTFVVSITTRLGNVMVTMGCDLLEKSYLCGINNNVRLRGG